MGASLRQSVSVQLAALSRWAHLPPGIADRLTGLFDIFTCDSLEQSLIAPFSGLSHINSSGLPFQWCFSFGSERSVRFLCEAGVPGTDPGRRLQDSIEALGGALAVLGTPEPHWLSEILVAHLLPTEGEWPDHWGSAMWFGVGASRSLVATKVYVNLKRDAPVDRWRRVGWVLKCLGRTNSLRWLCDLSRSVSADSWPVGVAFDIRPDGGAGRVKTYFRAGAVREDWLQRWYAAVGAEAEFAAVRCLLDSFPRCGRLPYPSGSFVVSLEFHGSDDDPSLKTDLGVTRWLGDDLAIVSGTRRAMTALGLDDGELTAALRAIGAWPPPPSEACPSEPGVQRFVGLGFEPDGGHHVNVYVEPPLSPPPARPKSAPPASANGAVREAVRAAVGFLDGANSDGPWHDFDLPVGESDRWVTAYVLSMLGRVPPELVSSRERARAQKSLDWLVSCRTTGGGWGYNGTTADDADSTGWAILALRDFHRPVPAESLDIIQRCRTVCGGVSTYPPDTAPGGSWTTGVADVTPVALRALGPEVTLAGRAQSMRFLESVQQPDGTWPSFWWLTPLFGTCRVLEVMDQPSRRSTLDQTLRRWYPLGSFESALLLACRTSLGSGRRESLLLESLLAAQEAGGSWRGSAYLRLTDPLVDEPWKAIDAGPAFVDQKSVFTTATVLMALAGLV